MTLDAIEQFRRGTDAEIIGTAKQPGDDFVDTHETYTWYRAIAAAKASKRIMELGVRYGYSAIAMLKGADLAGMNDVRYIGVDDEADGIASNSIALKNIAGSFPWVCESNLNSHCKILKINTRNFDAVNASINDVGVGVCDLIHIDGDHSPEGIVSEIAIAKTWISPNGVILIDDIDAQHIKNAADKLCEEYGIIPMHIPTYHGMYLIDMRKRIRFA